MALARYTCNHCGLINEYDGPAASTIVNCRSCKTENIVYEHNFYLKSCETCRASNVEGMRAELEENRRTIINLTNDNASLRNMVNDLRMVRIDGSNLPRESKSMELAVEPGEVTRFSLLEVDK